MTIRVDGVYDIECADWDRFRCGEILFASGERIVSWDEDTFYDELRALDGVFWAHSGGRYDALWALDRAFDRGDCPKMTPRGAGLMSLRIGNVTLCDSAALWPDKLATVAKLGGTPKLELSLPCICGRACGGYCYLSRKLTPRERKTVETYLHGDCESLLHALCELRDRAAADGISLKPTVGASAWATAQSWLDLPSCAHDLGTYRQIREGAKGGRVEVFGMEADSGERGDIHASYPAALSRVALPEGEPTERDGKSAARAFSRGAIGIYQARLFVPECWVPPLPTREDDRLLYPWGEIAGAWTSYELAYALECGARILGFDGAITWPRSSTWLQPYASRIWSLREQHAASRYEPDRAYAKWLKWAANSLTGKLAQKPESDVYEYIPTTPGHVPEAEDGDAVLRVTSHGRVLAWEQTRIGACAHVEAYAFLTAFARCEHHRQMLAAGDGLLYGDTDSVYSRERVTRRAGDALGEWGYEGPMTDWSALSPKLYRYRCGGAPHCKDHALPEWHVRGKGLPGLTPEGFDALEAGESWVIERGVRGFRDAMRNADALFTRKRLERSVRQVPGWCGGREVSRDGRTMPTTVARYRARVVGGGWFGG